MKFDSPIEVSGIHRIVINRKMVWYLDSSAKMWFLDCGDCVVNPGKTRMKSDCQMKRWISKMLTKLKKSKTHKGCFTWANRAWVHGDTLNIVRRGP